MKRLYQKDPVWFAVLWIAIYVAGFSAAEGVSEAMGVPGLITVLLGALLSLALIRFIRSQGLEKHFGLCGFNGDIKVFIYFIPLMVISSVNLWCGISFGAVDAAAVLGVISMCFVAFLEEVIFRGLLFKGMCRDNIRTAVAVSSLTFGFGHIVNLLLGAPFTDTMLQLVYASGVGFCYTAVFLCGGSIVPCIISHGAVNSLSIFAAEPSGEAKVIIALVQTLISLGYGAWLLYNHGAETKE
ncbi:MAG: CPBP family intramembrane metalloprotease [Clostridia bacterium]|nr:CPBP family intramembrane metalloprotease [Clostridia bacterium]